MEDTSTNEVVEETVAETPEATTEEPSAPEAEPQTEQPLYAGKYKSPEELEKAYKEAQKLISEQGSKLKQAGKPDLPPDQQKILSELKSLGIATKEDLEQYQAVQTQAQKDSAEIQSLKLSAEQEQVLRRYANGKENLNKSMTECWNELQGVSGGKVVKKTVTVKPQTGNRTGFVEKTPQELTKLSQEDYDKYWNEYRANKAVE